MTLNKRKKLLPKRKVVPGKQIQIFQLSHKFYQKMLVPPQGTINKFLFLEG